MLAVASSTRNLSVLLSAVEELCNMNSPSASPETVVRIIRIHVHVPRVAAATIRGWGLVEIWYHHHYDILRLLLLLQLLYCLPRTLLLERWRTGTCCISVWPNHCSAWSNLMQKIQFLEFMGGSNSTHTHSNYLICMHFIWINTVHSSHACTCEYLGWA